MEDLDELLDSALDDFQKVDITQSSGVTSSSYSRGSASKEIVARNSQGDQPSSSGIDGSSGEAIGLGLGLGLPGLATKGKMKTARGKGSSASSSSDGTSSSGAAATRERGIPRPDGPLSATLEKLAQQTRETVGNIDAVDDDNLMGDEFVENLMKQFEELGGSQDMQSIMDTMMRQLLSKEVLHEPMKEIGNRYPQWLAANKSNMSQEDYSRYSRQHQFIMQLCDVYEATPDDFQKVMELMQSMQNCGQPPADIVKELAPGLDLDREGLPMLPDFSALGSGGQPNCSIM